MNKFKIDNVNCKYYFPFLKAEVKDGQTNMIVAGKCQMGNIFEYIQYPNHDCCIEKCPLGKIK